MIDRIKRNKFDLFFYSILILLLFPVWQSKYFITGDGPAHLYNSFILNELLSETHSDFYLNFYKLNLQLDPNWFTHAFFTTFLFFFKPFLVEKILITTYVIGYCLSLRKLLKTINSGSEWLVIIAMPFVYQKVFYLGFYNCVISYIFFFLIVDYYLRKRNKLNLKNSIILMGLLVITYFTHLIGLALSLLTLATLFVFEFVSEIKNKSYRGVIVKAFKLILITLPSLLLVINYLNEATHTIGVLSISKKALYHQLIEGNFMFNIDLNDKAIGIIFSSIIGMLFIYGLIINMRSKKFNLLDSFFIVFVSCVLLYFYSPAGLAGGSLITERLQFVIFIVLLLWLAKFNYWKYFKAFLMTLSLGTTIGMMYIQIPIQSESSEYAEEVIELSRYIDDESVILPLNFNFNGCSINGERITNHLWNFRHISDYIGTEKSIVSLVNYEAQTGYFPLIYKEDINPYIKMNHLESLPPTPDFKRYMKISDVVIDYIVLLCYEKQTKGNKKVLSNLNYLNENYELTYESSKRRVKLYKRI